MIPPIFDRIMIFYLLPLERASFLPQIGGFLLYTTPAQCDASSDRTYARTDCTDSHTRDEPRSFVTCDLCFDLMRKPCLPRLPIDQGYLSIVSMLAPCVVAPYFPSYS